MLPQTLCGWWGPHGLNHTREHHTPVKHMMTLMPTRPNIYTLCSPTCQRSRMCAIVVVTPTSLVPSQLHGHKYVKNRCPAALSFISEPLAALIFNPPNRHPPPLSSFQLKLSEAGFELEHLSTIDETLHGRQHRGPAVNPRALTSAIIL